MLNSSASKCKESKCKESSLISTTSPFSAPDSGFDDCVVVDPDGGMLSDGDLPPSDSSWVMICIEDRSKDGSVGERYTSSVGVSSASDEDAVGHGENWTERESGEMGIGMG